MSKISDQFPGITFFSGEYDKFSKIVYNDQIIEENLPNITSLVIKTNNKIKSLSHILEFFPNPHTIKIHKSNKVIDFRFLSELKHLKKIWIEETQSQKDWEFLKGISLEDVSLYDESNVLVNSLPITVKKLSLYGSFDFSYLTNLKNLNELLVDNSLGNPLLKEVKDLSDEYELPKLPPSLTRLVIRGSCKLKSVKCLENLNDECEIYIPGKGCEGLEIPERFTNVSR